MQTPYAPDNKIRLPLEHYLREFAAVDPAEASERTGIPFDGEKKSFSFRMLGKERSVSWPEFKDEGWTDTERILVMRFLLEGSRPPAHTGFMTYREMPWGEVYDTNFQGRCVFRLARTFGTDPALFKKAAEEINGLPIQSSAVAYELEFMKGLYLRFFLWEGDDEFKPSAQILFSDNFSEVFTAEDRVIVCELTIAELKRLSTVLK